MLYLFSTSSRTVIFSFIIYRKGARVVFFAPTVALVRQQYQEFKNWFSAYKVDYIFGDEVVDKPDVDVMLEFNQVRHVRSGVY